MLCAAFATSVTCAQDTAGDLEPDQALARKIDGYVECINHHSGDVSRTQNQYLGWMEDEEKGPTGREAFVGGIMELNESSRCREHIAHAASLSPAMPELESLASNWLAALNAATEVVHEAHTYYALESYKDDGMRKGKELHPRLMQAFARFDEEDARLYAQIKAMRDEIDQENLKRLAADPSRRREYLRGVLHDRAKKMLSVSVQAGTPDFKLEALNSTMTEFETSYFELEAFLKPHMQDREYRNDVGVLKEAFEYLKQTKTLQRRVRDKTPFSDGERMLINANAAQMVDGHPAKVRAAYNSFISALNW